ncbi:MAG: TlpA family protein disulfide reductase [Clostridia bacterium]|nr:TlpA family protein disulfide reductase [Clostridia bacterium]
MKKLIILLISISLLLISCGNSQSEQEKGLLPAYDFTMQDYDGNSIKLSDLIDKPIVLNFWATWCPPCRAELPDFQEAYEKYGKEINFVIVDLTDGDETVEKAKAYLSENSYTFPCYFDVNGEGSYFYNLTSIPRTYFIATNGYVQYKVEKMITMSVLEYGIGLIK